jgi:acyl-coenzyme A thioesterase PaaI-like protein
MKEKITELVVKLGDDTSHCYACGQENPQGLRVAFAPDGGQGSRATYTARAEHDGWPGILHGGVTFTLMDESLGWALYFQGMRGVTAKAETGFKKPIRTGTPLVIRGWIVRRRRQLITARAEIRVDGPDSELMAEMDATMFLLAENAPQNESAKLQETKSFHMELQPR